MERRAILALVLVGLGGCKQLLGFDDPTIAPDAEPAADDGYLSGTRLKLKWNDYSGTRQFVSVYDADFDETCQPTVWSDGATYCMPRTGGVSYTDAACTQPIGAKFHQNPCIPQPRFFAAIEALACNEVRRTKLFRSAGLQASVPFYTRNASGGCDGPNPGTSFDEFRLTAEVPTTDLVDLTPTTEAMGRLARRGFHGSDGSRLPFDVYDTTLDTPCALSTSGTCAPTGASPLGFEDASCNLAVAARLTGCPTPKYGARARRPGCPDQTLDFFALGPELDTSSLYQRDSSNVCVGSAQSPGYMYFGQGMAVLPATLARTVDTAPGRQIQRVYFTDAMAKLRTAMLFDTLHGTDCFTVGGRCLPSDASAQTYYTSILCNTAVDVAIVFSGPPACGLPPAPRYAIKSTAGANACEATYEVFPVGAPHPGMVFARSADGLMCSPLSIQGSVVYDLGKPIDASEFATSTVITDP